MDWTLFWLILYVVIIASTVVVILLENRNPLKAISWIVVLLLLPIFGLIIYLIFGRDTRDKRVISKRSYDRINNAATPKAPILPTSEGYALREHQLLANLIRKQSGTTLMVASEIATFTDGISKLQSLLADIEQAKEHIHMQYYRFLDDRTGIQIGEALIRKAKEGVRVRLLYDHVGSFSTSNRFFEELRRHGVEAVPFMPVVFPEFTSKVNYRNHRKVVVIDSCIGYIGGMNIADHYTYGNDLGQWRDTHFRITGKAVNGLQAAFFVDWYVATRKILSSRLYYHHLDLQQGDEQQIRNDSEAYQKAPKSFQAPMQIFTSGPTGHVRLLLQALCKGIYQAKQKVLIHTPYFLPTDSLNKAIVGAALSGVHVELLLPWASDTFAVKYAAHSYFQELLDAGVHIYRYDGGFLHSKLITIDNEVAFIGSANMDFRSMEHNFEITAVVYDTGFATQLSDTMEADREEHGVAIDPQRWQKRSIWRRLLESLLRLFAPLL